MHIPTFHGTPREQIPHWVNYIDHAVQRKCWSNEDYKKKAGQRSAHQILIEGDTGYMGACYDLTLATAALALQTTTPTLVIEEIESRKYGYLLHFVLEVDGGFVEYAVCNQVFTGTGTYPGIWKKDDKTLATQRTVLTATDLERTPAIIVPPVHYPRYNLEERLRQIAHDNTETTWQLYQKAIAQQPHLTINQHPLLVRKQQLQEH
ncbi:MAG: hypothetical protein Q7R96_00915 [Nanoarchaeota archaeon]|nr:hypothetical protein [Nanoarchaeota archaeon]